LKYDPEAKSGAINKAVTLVEFGETVLVPSAKILL
jgi:hypothetical protein